MLEYTKPLTEGSALRRNCDPAAIGGRPIYPDLAGLGVTVMHMAWRAEEDGDGGR